MKMYSPPISFLMGLLLLAIACQSPSEETTVIVPELLDRSELIQNGKEWGFTQSLYQKNNLAAQQDKNNTEARLQLCQVFIQEARVTGEHGHYYPAALEMVNQILSVPNLENDIKFRALTTQAGVLLSLHEFNKALEVAQKAVILNPHNAKIYGVLTDCYVELGEYEKAVSVADQMINIRPDMRSYARVSYLREIHGDIEGAQEAMKLAVKAGYPGQEETAWSMLQYGEMLLKYGNKEAARSVFNEILEVRENYPFAVGAIAEIQYQDGQLEQAEKTLNEAISIIPEVGFYIQMAQIYKDLNRTDELSEILEEIKFMLEDDVAAGHNMNLEYADLYLHLIENNEEALKYAEIEYEKRPKNIDVNLKMAEIHFNLNRTVEAELFLSAASKTQSKNPDLIALLSK